MAPFLAQRRRFRYRLIAGIFVVLFPIVFGGPCKSERSPGGPPQPPCPATNAAPVCVRIRVTGENQAVLQQDAVKVRCGDPCRTASPTDAEKYRSTWSGPLERVDAHARLRRHHHCSINAPSREWQSSCQATARARLCIHRREGGRLCQKLHTIRTQLSVFPKKQPAHSLLSSLSVSARLLLSSFCLQGSGSCRNGLIYSDGLSKASSGADGGKHGSSSAPANTPQDGF